MQDRDPANRGELYFCRVSTGEDMKIVTMEEINAVSADDRKIQQEDRRIDKEIENLADRILQERSVRPIVLISGPSGSGKRRRLINWNGF